MDFTQKVKYDQKGLVIAIVQDHETKEVIMCAYMNEAALKKTIETGRMTYFSRSRNKLWLKGEQSGNFQELKEARFDCDGDAILFKVSQKGGACHEGWRSCFSYLLSEKEIIEDGEKVFDPKAVYKK